MSDVTQEQVAWMPSGESNPISAVYAHVIIGADLALNTWIGARPPLLATAWGGRVGLSELMPATDWHSWAMRVQMDLTKFRKYAADVYGAWGEYLASLTSDDLSRCIDLEMIGMGKRTLAECLAIQVEHFSGHCGEIACLKGLQGATGYRPGTARGKG